MPTKRLPGRTGRAGRAGRAYASGIAAPDALTWGISPEIVTRLKSVGYAVQKRHGTDADRPGRTPMTMTGEDTAAVSVRGAEEFVMADRGRPHPVRCRYALMWRAIAAFSTAMSSSVVPPEIPRPNRSPLETVKGAPPPNAISLEPEFTARPKSGPPGCT